MRETRKRIIEELTIFEDNVGEEEMLKIEEWLRQNSTFVHNDYCDGVKEFLVFLPHPSSKRATLEDLLEDAPDEIADIFNSIYKNRLVDLEAFRNLKESDTPPEYDIDQDFGFVLVELFNG